MRYPLIDREEFKVTWDFVCGLPTLHLELRQKYTPSMKKKLLGQVYLIREMFGNEGWDCITAVSYRFDEKLLKFIVSLGFEPFAYVDDADGNHIFVVSKQSTIKGIK